MERKEVIAKRGKSVISGKVWKKVVGTDKLKVRVQRVGEETELKYRPEIKVYLWNWKMKAKYTGEL